MKYADILSGLTSKSTHEKGLALEALAFYLARLLGLEFVQWRLRSNKTGGGEVDAVMEGARLIFSRWRVVCKSQDHIIVDDLAVELGLSVSSKPNVILVLTTGLLTKDSHAFARAAKFATNVSVVVLDQDDMNALRGSPDSPRLVLDRLHMKFQDIVSAENSVLETCS